jgi:hypothetical protein
VITHITPLSLLDIDLASMVGGMKVRKSNNGSSITSGDSDYGTVTGSNFGGTYAELLQYRQVRHDCYCLQSCSIAGIPPEYNPNWVLSDIHRLLI